ncbi:MAG: hypothetical protein MHM6MM_008546, partial [Cercozoa sp. M6MM]
MGRQYNFRAIQGVPSGMEMVDIVLNRIQRKTPTVVHAGWEITRIREFYMRKVKFAQQEFAERLGRIVEQFPRLDDLHPFYKGLLNVNYDRDHYKVALAKVNLTKQIVENVAKEKVTLLKYGDSLYRCKRTKRAALGHMASHIKKLSPFLVFLEKVREHLSRLPQIEPDTCTLLLTGFPNVGKSSLINKLSRADSEVQNYSFTTKALTVGHFDHRFNRWQVIDSPGLLDRSLDEWNTIEMQAVTALAHVHSCVLFLLDVSGVGKYSISEQVSLFTRVRKLFANKPALLVATKIDLRGLEDVTAEERAELESIGVSVDMTQDGKEASTEVVTQRVREAAEAGKSTGRVPLLALSNATEAGIMAVRNAGAALLQEKRMQQKVLLPCPLFPCSLDPPPP